MFKKMCSFYCVIFIAFYIKQELAQATGTSNTQHLCFHNGTIVVYNPDTNMYRSAQAFNSKGACNVTMQENGTQLQVDGCEMNLHITLILSNATSGDEIGIVGGNSHQIIYQLMCQSPDENVFTVLLHLGVTHRPSTMATVVVPGNTEDNFLNCYTNGSISVRNPNSKEFTIGTAYENGVQCDTNFTADFERMEINNCSLISSILVVFEKKTNLFGILGGRSPIATFQIRCMSIIEHQPPVIGYREDEESSPSNDLSLELYQAESTNPEGRASSEKVNIFSDNVAACYDNNSMVVLNPDPDLYMIGDAHSNHILCETTFSDGHRRLLIENCDLTDGVLVVFSITGIIDGRRPMTTFKAQCPDEFFMKPERRVAPENMFESTPKSYLVPASFKISSSLRSPTFAGHTKSVLDLGEPVIWTIDIPASSSMKPESCIAHTGDKLEPSTETRPILMHGCCTDHNLCTDFTTEHYGLVEESLVRRHYTTLRSFNLQGSDSVTIRCKLRICSEEHSAACDLTTCHIADIVDSEVEYRYEDVTLTFLVVNS